MDGRWHGHGVMTLANGITVECDFDAGEVAANGACASRTADRDVARGSCRRERVLQWRRPQQPMARTRAPPTRPLVPAARAGRVTFPGPDGLVFTGELDGGFPGGRGALAFRGGAVLTGTFARVASTLLLNADGELTLPDGSRRPATMRAWRVTVAEPSGGGSVGSPPAGA